MGEPILQKVWIIWSRLLYFNFKSFLDPDSSPFIRFQCILYDSGVLFSEFSNFEKLQWGDLISGVNEFCRKSELFGSSFCISVLKVLWTQIFRHSLDFNAFSMIHQSFSKSRQISTNWRGGSNFWVEPILQKVWIIWSPLVYFNFKSFVDPNSSSFIRFQCILHDSGVLFAEP